MKRARAALAALLLGVACHSAAASELRGFHEALADAWGFYRGAVFYLRTGNAMVAGFELEQMRSRWTALQARYATRPPDAYAGDTGFAGVLADGLARTEAAIAAAQAGDAETASETLAPLRGAMAALRARAGVRTFSDCVDETNAAMDALYAYRRDLPPLADLAVVNDIKAKSAVYRYLLERCDAEAGDALRADPEFRRLVDVSVASVGRLFEALDRRDATAVVNILRELRSSDRLLFLKFG